MLKAKCPQKRIHDYYITLPDSVQPGEGGICPRCRKKYIVQSTNPLVLGPAEQ
jgi:hypothetical protein